MKTTGYFLIVLLASACLPTPTFVGSDMSDDSGGLTPFPLTPLFLERNVDGWGFVDAGEDATCAIAKNLDLFCWGEINFEENAGVVEPTKIAESVVDVSVGRDLICYLTEAGEPLCFGIDGRGILDGEDARQPSRIVVSNDRTAQNVLDVSVGVDHVCFIEWNSSNALRSVGRVVCIGEPADGRLLTPTGLLFESVEAGVAHTVSKHRETNELDSWGENSNGRLGHQQANGPNTVDEIGPVKKYSVSDVHSCAVGDDDRLWCWGDNEDKQIGDPSIVATTDPEKIGLDTWIDVTAGARHTCAISTQKTLNCWGQNENAQLGLANFQVITFTLTGNENGVYQIDIDGQMYGTNYEGETVAAIIADIANSIESDIDASVDVETSETADTLTVKSKEVDVDLMVSTIAPGESMWMTTEANSAVVETPRQASTTSYSSLSAGDIHTCAITMDNQLECWGNVKLIGQPSSPDGKTHVATAIGAPSSYE